MLTKRGAGFRAQCRVLPAAIALFAVLVTIALSGGSAYATFQAVGARPAGGVSAISTQVYHTCAVEPDGTVACWGNDNNGQSSPPTNAGFIGVAVGNFHSCGLRADGVVQCWGDNSLGQSAPPAGVLFTQIAGGSFHTCGLRQDGTAQCWGLNGSGQSDPPPGVAFTSISSGDDHNCGLRQDGTAQCWGDNTAGKSTPPLGITFTEVSAGSSHTCGLQQDGTAQCWGSNNEGQSTPPPGVLFSTVAAGGQHTCGVRRDGAVQCWGLNSNGQATPPPGNDFAYIAAGRISNCAIRQDGIVRCWGSNSDGQAPQIVLSPDSLPEADAGMPYSQDFAAAGGSAAPYAFSLLTGTLPRGLSLGRDGLLAGTPDSGGVYSFAVRAVDYNYIAGEQAYTLTVNLPPTGTSTQTATLSPSSPATRPPTGTPSNTPTACPLFTDVQPGSTFYSFIRCLACKGVISGYSDGTFREGNPVSRGQIAKIVANAAGFSEDAGEQVYEDIAAGSPFYVWINRLSRRGYMGGYPCGGVGEPCVEPGRRPYFRPNSNASRGQLSKIVANTAGFSEAHTSQTYADVPPDNPFYIWVERLSSRNVMGGYSCGGPGEPCDAQNRPYFRPGSEVTRGQAAKIVANTFFPGCGTP